MFRIGVIGGGTMGTGIAYVCAQAGTDVFVVEPDKDRADRMREAQRAAAQSAISRGKLAQDEAAALEARIQTLSKLSDLPRELDLIIESIFEDLELKRATLREAALLQPALLASNTSALSIDKLAQDLPSPERFLGMHFFNPVWSLKLVEIVRGEKTSDDAVEAARNFAHWMGKESLVVRDIPGFATSRLDLIASLEAMRMVESGVTSAEEIDRAATIAYRHPVGPLRLSDIVGLDVRLDIARALEEAHGPRFAPPQILIDMVKQGKLGVKSGQGFYSWTD
jgi:3-hydroxybutyryl-CoA dehydrogenase